MTRRGVLTVDLDCANCGGTGVVIGRVGVPGTARMGGGPSGAARAIGVERRCSCVRVAPVHSEADGGVSIGALSALDCCACRRRGLTVAPPLADCHQSGLCVEQGWIGAPRESEDV